MQFVPERGCQVMPSDLTFPTDPPIVRIVPFVPAPPSSRGRLSSGSARKPAKPDPTVTSSLVVVREPGRDPPAASVRPLHAGAADCRRRFGGSRRGPLARFRPSSEWCKVACAVPRSCLSARQVGSSSESSRLVHRPARSNLSARRSSTASGMPSGTRAGAYSWTCESTISSIIYAVDRCHHHIVPAWMPKPMWARKSRRGARGKSCCGSEWVAEAQPWSRKHRPVQSSRVASAVVEQRRVVHGATAGFAVLHEQDRLVRVGVNKPELARIVAHPVVTCTTRKTPGAVSRTSYRIVGFGFADSFFSPPVRRSSRSSGSRINSFGIGGSGARRLESMPYAAANVSEVPPVTSLVRSGSGSGLAAMDRSIRSRSSQRRGSHSCQSARLQTMLRGLPLHDQVSARQDDHDRPAIREERFEFGFVHDLRCITVPVLRRVVDHLDSRGELGFESCDLVSGLL